MKKLILASLPVFFFFLISTGFLQAQKLVFCASVSTEGEPTGESTTWNINTLANNSATFLYTAPSGSKVPALIVFKLEKQDETGNWAFFDDAEYQPDVSKGWAAFYYPFAQSGKYVVKATDNKGKVLAQNEIDVTIVSHAENDSNTYYEGSKIQVGTAMRSGNLVGIDTAFKFTPDGKFLFVSIEHYLALNTPEIRMDIERCRAGQDTGEVVNSQTFKTDATALSDVFKMNFPAPGRYKIMLYTADKKPINNTMVTLRW
jgi:hypothetical protein